jgi:hypothetical protein
MTCIAIAVVAMSACGGSSKPHALALGTPHADDANGRLVSTLVPPSATFRVVFAWKDGAPGGGDGAFVWEQAGGQRRWDFSPEGAAKARIGWLSVEGAFNDVGTPASTLDCLWEHADGQNVRVGCDAVRPNHPGADALTRAFSALRVTGRYDDRTIAGRQAKCYAFPDSQDSSGAICIDATDGTPLAFEATGTGRNKAFHAFEATSVGPGPQSIPQPANVPAGTVLSPVTRNAAVLSLPPEFVLPQ